MFRLPKSPCKRGKKKTYKGPGITRKSLKKNLSPDNKVAVTTKHKKENSFFVYRIATSDMVFSYMYLYNLVVCYLVCFIISITPAAVSKQIKSI
jgi:hypothetical protein